MKYGYYNYSCYWCCGFLFWINWWIAPSEIEVHHNVEHHSSNNVKEERPTETYSQYYQRYANRYYDSIEYIDKDTGKMLIPDDFHSKHYLPKYKPFLSFNGVQNYRVVDVRECVGMIRDIKEHGGSDYNVYAIVTVESFGEKEPNKK